MIEQKLLKLIQQRAQYPKTRTDMSDVLMPELFPPTSHQKLEQLEGFHLSL